MMRYNKILLLLKQRKLQIFIKSIDNHFFSLGGVLPILRNPVEYYSPALLYSALQPSQFPQANFPIPTASW